MHSPEDKLMNLNLATGNPGYMKRVYITSDIFGKMLFIRSYPHLSPDTWTVFLADSKGDYYYSDTTSLTPEAYVQREEAIVYDDLANEEWERTKRDFEEIFGTL